MHTQYSLFSPSFSRKPPICQSRASDDQNTEVSRHETVSHKSRLKNAPVEIHDTIRTNSWLVCWGGKIPKVPPRKKEQEKVWCILLFCGRAYWHRWKWPRLWKMTWTFLSHPHHVQWHSHHLYRGTVHCTYSSTGGEASFCQKAFSVHPSFWLIKLVRSKGTGFLGQRRGDGFLNPKKGVFRAVPPHPLAHVWVQHRCFYIYLYLCGSPSKQ